MVESRCLSACLPEAETPNSTPCQGLPMQTEPFGLLTLDSTQWRQLHNWFLGIGYDDHSIVIGDEGFRAYQAEHGTPDADAFEEGRYIAVLERDAYFSVLTDPMGQDALYYYSPDDLRIGGPAVARWAVSNSLLALARKARQFGSLALYRPSVLGFQVSAGRAIGAQLFSNNTPLRGARVLPLGCELRISKSDGSASLHRVRRGDWLMTGDGRGYEELIADYVRKSVARCTALRASGQIEILCDVSGGHDSRAVMGMLARSGGTAPIVYTSDANKPQDYRIAKRLASHFGTELSVRAQVPVSVNGHVAFDIWAHGSTGVYLPIVTPRSKHEARRLRFHGGNFLSKEFGELPAEQKARSLGKWIKTGPRDRQAVMDEFLRSFAQIDMDAAAPFAMQMHYVNFRGRFHYGRNWYSHTRAPMVTPLISQLLAKAAFQLTPEAYNHSQISLDLLLALDNALGTIPFDSPEKDFPQAAVAASPFWRRPVTFSPDSSDLPKVYGLANAARATQGMPESGPAFMDVFRERFPELMERVRDEGLFDETYLEKAQHEAKTPRAPAHQMRASAHVVHTGLLLSEVA